MASARGSFNGCYICESAMRCGYENKSMIVMVKLNNIFKASQRLGSNDKGFRYFDKCMIMCTIHLDVGFGSNDALVRHVICFMEIEAYMLFSFGIHVLNKKL